jgi:hypothetical protein
MAVHLEQVVIAWIANMRIQMVVVLTKQQRQMPLVLCADLQKTVDFRTVHSIILLVALLMAPHSYKRISFLRLIFPRLQFIKLI